MSSFFWASDHVGWLFFAILVFSGLWLLLSDLIWRMKSARSGRIAAVMCALWAVVVVVMIWAARAVH